VTSWPDTVEETSSAPIIGMVASPALVGDQPRAIWKYWPKKTEAPNIPTPTAIEAMIASAVVRSRTMGSGMIGSRTRLSTSTVSSRATRPPPAMTADCQETQSNSLPAKVTQMSRSLTAAVTSVAPSQSMLTGRRTVGRCSVFCSSTRAMRASGTQA
jgi:hypothetical protein